MGAPLRRDDLRAMRLTRSASWFLISSVHSWQTLAQYFALVLLPNTFFQSYRQAWLGEKKYMPLIIERKCLPIVC